jgi:arylformamidase
MKIYDLTPMINSKLAVFPGDVSFQRNVSMDFSSGQHLTLSSIQTTLHLGAHADSSNHYHAKGQGVEARPLSAFLGSTQVLHVEKRSGERIQMKDLHGKKIQAPRVLFRTGSFPNPENWNSDFMSLSPEVIEFLHQQGCLLVGIDTPSVDPEQSKALESHQALYRTGMAVLEGLILAQVPEGLYTLIALPLPIQNADASPVRALLVDSPDLFANQKIEWIQPF